MRVVNNKLIVLKMLFLMSMMASSFLFAQSAPDTSAPKPISISGFLDLYYSQNFNNPAVKANKYRNFDVTSNQFSLGLAEIVFQKPAEPIGFRIDLDFGPTTDLIHTDASGKTNEAEKHLQQAYLTTVIPVGNGLTVNAGKMVTHMGAEVIESQLNINYSRSLLFAYAIPYYHVGICASYPFATNFTATGYLYNGWNSNFDNIDNNTEKTYGLSLSWLPKDNFQIIGNWIGGAEQATTNNKKHVFDGIINYTASDKLLFTLNADYGFERQVSDDLAIWKGIAAIGKYSISDSKAIAVRAEVFSDPTGYATGAVQDLKEITVTYELKYLSNLLLRLEYRRDWSTIEIFDNADGVTDTKSQNTLLLGAVVSF